jgi:hypothetical protein
VNSGNRSAYLPVLSLLGVLAAADAGRVGEDGAGSIWLAPELVELLEPGLGEPTCGGSRRVQSASVSDEGGGVRPVSFEWNPRTGELSFETRVRATAFPLPEAAVTAAAVRPVQAHASPGCD